jgi:hypothetical protein
MDKAGLLQEVKNGALFQQVRSLVPPLAGGLNSWWVGRWLPAASHWLGRRPGQCPQKKNNSVPLCIVTIPAYSYASKCCMCCS